MIIGTALLTSLAWNAPLPTTYSNRLGLTLTPITTGVWAAEHQAKRFGGLVDVGARTVLLRGADGKLVVYAPSTAPSDELKEGIDALGGGVGAIIGKTQSCGEVCDDSWRTAYPSAKWIDANFLAEEDIAASLPPGFESVVVDGDGQYCPDRIDGRLLSAVLVDPWMPPSPLLFLRHKKSGTVLCGDGWWNYPKSPRPNQEGNIGAEGTGAVHSCSKVPVDAVDTLPDARVPTRTLLWSLWRNRVLWPLRRSLISQGGPNIFGYVVLAGGRPAGTPLRLYRDQVSRLLDWDAETLIPTSGDVLKGKGACRVALSIHFLPMGFRSSDLPPAPVETKYAPGFYRNEAPAGMTKLENIPRKRWWDIG